MLLLCFIRFVYVRVKKGNQETDFRQGSKRRSLRLLNPGEDGSEGICWKMEVRDFLEDGGGEGICLKMEVRGFTGRWR